MNKGKNKLISEASKRRKLRDSYKLELSIEGNRLFLRGLGNNSVSVKMEVTPLWHFFKGAQKLQQDKKEGRTPNPNDPDYEDIMASL